MPTSKVKVEDMPYYVTRESKRKDLPEVRNTTTLQYIEKSREAVFSTGSILSAHITQATSFLHQVNPLYLKLGAISTASGLTFLATLARRRSRTTLRLILYPSIVAGIAGAVCFPEEYSNVYNKYSKYLPDPPQVQMPGFVKENVDKMRVSWESLKKDRHARDEGQSNKEDDDLYTTRR